MIRQHWFVVLSALALVLSVLACSQPLPTTPTAESVVTNTAVPATPDNTAEWVTTVIRPVVNVRDKPDGGVIGSLKSGTSVEIVECTGNWCQIVKPAGWIWRGCLSDNPKALGCEAK